MRPTTATKATRAKGDSDRALPTVMSPFHKRRRGPHFAPPQSETGLLRKSPCSHGWPASATIPEPSNAIVVLWDLSSEGDLGEKNDCSPRRSGAIDNLERNEHYGGSCGRQFYQVGHAFNKTGSSTQTKEGFAKSAQRNEVRPLSRHQI